MVLLRSLLGVAGGLLAAAVLGPAQAADASYPAKPIRFIVAFPAGSGTDTVARVMAKTVTDQTGQPVVVDNRGGANGFIASQAVATAAPDGYTFLFTTSTTHAANAAMFKSLPYDPIKDFEPVSLVTKNGLVLLVRSDSRYRKVEDLIADMKNRPGKLNFGAGSASTQVAGEMFKMGTHTDAVYVPYKGMPQALTDLVAGQIDFAFSDINPAVPLVEQGKLRALAVTTQRRHPAFKPVPTLDEAGLKGFELSTWSAVFAPAGTPAPIVEKMSRLLQQGQRTREAQEQLERSGAEGATGSPEELRGFVKSESEKWARVIEVAGIPRQ